MQTEKKNEVYSPLSRTWTSNNDNGINATSLYDKYGLSLYRIKIDKHNYAYWKISNLDNTGPKVEFIPSQFELVQLKQQLDKIDVNSQLPKKPNEIFY